jgi:hypothetical protein
MLHLVVRIATSGLYMLPLPTNSSRHLFVCDSLVVRYWQSHAVRWHFWTCWRLETAALRSRQEDVLLTSATTHWDDRRTIRRKSKQFSLSGRYFDTPPGYAFFPSRISCSLSKATFLASTSCTGKPYNNVSDSFFQVLLDCCMGVWYTRRLKLNTDTPRLTQ